MKNTYKPISDARIKELTDSATEVKARIYVLRRIRVRQNMNWNEAIDLIGPNTPSCYNIRRPEISAQYRPVSDKEEETDIVLLNYLSSGNLDMALAWGKRAKIRCTNPREVFAVGSKKDCDLNTLFEQKLVNVISTTGCVFSGRLPHQCYVEFCTSKRRASLHAVDNYLNGSNWFGFAE